MNYYLEKETDYFTNIRKDVLAVLPEKKGMKVLEIGCGGGNTLVYLKETGLASYAVGVEMFDMPGTNQLNPLIDKLVLGNIEEIVPDLPTGHFDVIICADVLEHLVDPWAVVQKITPFLKPGGSLVLSVPNIQEFRTMAKIWKGDFAYDPEGGILDKTHLRFFCKKNIRQLLELPQFAIEGIWPSFLYNKDQKKLKLLNQLTLGRFESFLAIQYLARATRK